MFVLESIKRYAKTDGVALINREERLTFEELDARSEAFAAWLLERFGDDRTPVVLYGHKETDFLPCIYGSLKAGRGYVPVDLVVPPDRAAEMIADVRPKVIVNFSQHLLHADAVVLNSQELTKILSGTPESEVDRSCWAAGEDIAYILFTSGSTGKPKGVPITVNNLASFYRGLLPYLEETEGGVILNQISYSFDVSCCSVYAGISRGMTLFTIDKEMVADMMEMFAYLEKSQLTLWVSTPSFGELCAQSRLFSAKLLPHLERFLFCGEVLTHRLCDGLAERFPRAGVLNTYGPTEATVLVTAVQITGEMRREEYPIPIGRPLEEVELRIVDEQGMELTGDEQYGELLIVGGSVGPGYHNCPEQTAKAFFADERTGKLGYRTGDICCRRNGLYYYVGRADNQLKLNGYRVEVEDIENNLAQLDNIARAAVVPVWADTERSRVQYLAAFLLLEREDGLTSLKRSIQIKKKAAAVLPPYMIPRKLIAVDAFPLNTNGKIDKKELAKTLEKAEKQ